MSRLCIILLGTILIGCLSKGKIDSQQSATSESIGLLANLVQQGPEFPFETIPGTTEYDVVVNSILTHKEAHRKAYDAGSITIDSIGNYFSQSLVNNIIPYWYGTTWDFNGHTDEPNVGTVACGYFVSTTLRHLELQVNRYKLAQQASLNIVKSLANNQNIHAYRNPDKEKMIAEISNFKEGIYSVGLSNHVGFLYVKNKEVYFLHSNYLSPGKVEAELASKSDAFIWSNVYYIGDISNNATLMKKWLNNEGVTIIGA